MLSFSFGCNPYFEFVSCIEYSAVDAKKMLLCDPLFTLYNFIGIQEFVSLLYTKALVSFYGAFFYRITRSHFFDLSIQWVDHIQFLTINGISLA